jgi:uncharacterized protein (DUF983 family)
MAARSSGVQSAPLLVFHPAAAVAAATMLSLNIAAVAAAAVANFLAASPLWCYMSLTHPVALLLSPS